MRLICCEIAAVLVICLTANIQAAQPGVESLPGWPGATSHSYPPLPHNRFTPLPDYAQWAFEDKAGRIWLGAQRSASFNQENIDSRQEIARIKQSMVLAFREERPLLRDGEIICEDAAGRLWVEVAFKDGQQKVFGYDGKEFWDCPAALFNTGCHENIYEDGLGCMWFMGPESVARLEKGAWFVTPRPDKIKSDGHQFSKDTWFAGSTDGLVLLLPWYDQGRFWCFHKGQFGPVRMPGGEGQGTSSCPLALDGGRILFTGYPPPLDRLDLDAIPKFLDAKLSELLAQLGDEQFETRDKATREIIRTAYAQRDAVESFGAKAMDAEVQMRIRGILRAWDKVVDDAVAGQSVEKLPEATELYVSDNHLMASAPRGLGWCVA